MVHPTSCAKSSTPKNGGPQRVRDGRKPAAVALYQKVFATAFMWHNYGNSTIGNRSDIENVGIDNLRAFYRTYYQPDNAVLLVAGKIDSAKTLAWIADHFGKVARPDP